MNKRFILVALSLLFGLLFAAFTLAVRDDWFNRIDFDVMVRMQDNIPRAINPYFSWFSTLSRFEVMVVITLIIMLVSRSFMSIIGFVSFVAMHVVGLFGKLFLTHPAPPFKFYRGTPNSLFPDTYVHTESSYPSGHSMRAVFVGMFLAGVVVSSKLSFGLKALLIFAICSVVGVVLFTRVALGEHWLSDVIGGALWGAALGFFTLIFLPDKNRVKKTHHIQAAS